MVFSTFTFLYFFLPLVLLFYFIIPNRAWRNAVLLVFSLAFYGWGEPKFLLLMLAASLVAYLGGLLIHRWQGGLKKAAMIVTVVLLVSNLFVFKYLNFAAENLHLSLPQIALPIGISFYTFQILSYVIDLYWGRIAVQKNFFYLTLYVCCFPQLIAGPIVRYKTVEEEICNREESWADAACGLRRFAVGLAKKTILANPIGALATLIYSGDPAVYGTGWYWVAAVAYALQIYFDFSGYSDMAIGLGRVFGFHFLENFDHPYTAASITDFWRRWHISLSGWFRDYIYIPLGGNRVSKPRWILNILIVWGLTGFWHGAQWNFLLWGLYYAALLLLEKLLLHKLLDKLPRFFGWLYTVVAVLVGWVFFNQTDLSVALASLGQMFSFRFPPFSQAIFADSAVLNAFLYLPLGVLCCFPWLKKRKRKPHPATDLLLNAGSVVLLILSLCYISGSTFNPFIYFRF
ncbi:MAG: MBOAT family protein [Clostridia bacterium]|nr:MBOAT family protein [Clostridia bacterium]